MAAAAPEHRLGLVLRPGDVSAVSLRLIAGWAGAHGFELLVRREDASRCPDAARPVESDELARSVGAILSVGGDGTMLAAMRLAARRRPPVPVLGVNLGHRGFLVEVGEDDLPAALDRLAAGAYDLEAHAGLDVTIHGASPGVEVAFNDIALTRSPGAGPIEASLAIGGRGHGRYRCDAVIVATPQGSTAYAYAAGGPIVSPALDAVVVTPAAPTSGISRPLVLPAAEPLRLTVLPARGAPVLEADGSAVAPLAAGDRVDVRIRREAARVVRLDRDRFERRNQVKLSLLGLPFLPEELRDAPPPGTAG